MASLGDRLRQARVARGLSLRDLAARLVGTPASVTPAALSMYERGERTPSPSTLLGIARALGVSSAYLLRQTQVELDCIQYRRGSGFGAKQRQSLEERVREWLERYLEVEDAFPPGWLEPPGISREDAQVITDLEQSEVLAESLRARWDLGLGPIHNLPETLEDHGVKVLQLSVEGRFDGLSCWAQGRIPTVMVNEKRPWDRQRFDLAHELGELLIDEKSTVDREKAAHRFAGAFLVPRSTVRRELGPHRDTLHLDELRLLKEEYGLSVAAWVFRAHDAGVIGGTTKATLFRKLSSLGLRHDEQTPPRAPDRASRFELLVKQARAEGLVGPVRARELLRGKVGAREPRADAAALEQAALAARDYYRSDPEVRQWEEFDGGVVDSDG